MSFFVVRASRGCWAVARLLAQVNRGAQFARYRVNADIASLHAANQQGAPADSAKPTR